MTIREEMAEIEHQQWQKWVNTMSDRFTEWKTQAEVLCDDEMVRLYETKMQEQIEIWSENNIGYSLLPEYVKNKDREYADKVIKIITKRLDERIEELKPYEIENMARAELEQFKRELEK